MKYVRTRWRDVNAAQGTTTVPLSAAATATQAIGIQDRISNIVEPHFADTALIIDLAISPDAGTAGATATVGDTAVMVFKSAGIFPLRVTLLGPKDIFLADGLTIDTGNPYVADLIAYVLAWAVASDGSTLTGYSTGRRI